MFSKAEPKGAAQRIAITVPVIFLVLSATALPIEIRPLGSAAVHLASTIFPILW